jgi:IclR family transcriptional regulator, pca regulon regulatory protein
LIPFMSTARKRKPAVTADNAGAERQFVQAFARGLRVIQAFGAGAGQLTLSGVAARTDLTRAGARRLLHTLETLGFAARSERYFYLTPKVLGLGHAYLSSMPLWNFAESVLQRLVEDVRETCSVSVLDETEVVYVLRVPVHRILSTGASVGSRLPAHCTSMGRVLLAGLSEVQLEHYFDTAALTRFSARTTVDAKHLRRILAADRARGWSWVSGEMEEHISGLSVPVADAEQRVLAALNISFNRVGLSKDGAVKKYLPRLRRAAEQMNASLALNGGRRA